MSAGRVNNGLALSIRDVTKVFGPKGEGSLLAGLRRQLGKANGNGKSKPVVAVDGVSLEVGRNEIFGILGPNGSGKSTLIRLTATLLLPDKGQIQVFGLDVTRNEMEVKRLINRVSVDAAFFKKLSAIENLMYAGRLYGLTGREAREQAFAILHRLGLKDKEILGPLEDMSRGMQQKVAIARAFLSQPTLLLLDEPTTGLDPRSKREVQAFVRELRDTHDATILLTTHDMVEAEVLCDRIAVLDEGRVVALDTPAGLKTLVPNDNGHAPTLEDVFMALTGKELIKEEDRTTI
jgi:ABC-2 type transport system ATP-binding protein